MRSATPSRSPAWRARSTARWWTKPPAAWKGIAYVEKLEVALAAWRPDAECLVFGHIADGNLHIFVTPYEDGMHHDRCDELVYGCLDGFAGSISAEHGIGVEKKAWLGKTRSEEEIEMMGRLKTLLDPDGLLNPRNLLD